MRIEQVIICIVLYFLIKKAINGSLLTYNYLKLLILFYQMLEFTTILHKGNQNVKVSIFNYKEGNFRNYVFKITLQYR